MNEVAHCPLSTLVDRMSGNRDQESDESAAPDQILLGVLNAIERDARTSQRNISRELGVALGLANAYLKRCVGKGWIKVQQAPPRRYAYYLTPKGFAEKTRLTAEYFSVSFTFFRRAREQMSQLMAQCAANGWTRIAFAGISELAEVGILCAHDYPVSLVGVIDPTRAGTRFCGLAVCATLADLDGVDAVIITDIKETETIFHVMENEIEHGRILAPSLLGLRIRPIASSPAVSIGAAE